MTYHEITEDSFEGLLNWLGATRDEGAQKYEIIRTRLIRLFTKKGCTDPEDLTDITINRVTEKVTSIKTGYVGDPANYFVGVARLVFLESLRRKEIATESFPVQPAPDIAREAARDCLRKCLATLANDQRDLVLDYYVDEKRAKIESHRQLAIELRVSTNALRIRAHRLRTSLEKCVMECLAA